MSKDDNLEDFLKKALSKTKRRKKRHPDYVKVNDFGDFKTSISVWVEEDKAVLVVSTYENGKWTRKVREELQRWK